MADDWPNPEEVMALGPSARLTARIEELLEKNREGGLTAGEQREWERYEYLEHLVRWRRRGRAGG